MGPSCSGVKFLEAVSCITGCRKVGRDFRGGTARRPRGVKSGTCMRGALSWPPNTLLLLLTDRGVYGVVGGAMCPDLCFFCNARVLSRRFSLEDILDEYLMYYK